MLTMRVRFRCLCAAFVCALFAGSAHADPHEGMFMSVDAYRLLKQTAPSVAHQVMDAYLRGVLDGYGTSNGMLENDHKSTLYCQPEHLAIGVNNLEHLLDAEIEKPAVLKAATQVDVAALALIALIEAFPCREH